MMLKIGFCGVGNMSGAILNASLASGVLNFSQITAYTPSLTKLNSYEGITAADSNLSVCRECDVIFLGFKPQMLKEIASELNGKVDGKCFVSMLAGVSVSTLKKVLGDVDVIRVMPNTPITAGMGCTAIAQCGAPDEIYDLVCDIFKAAGTVVEVEEDDINRTIPLSGSSPAFFLRFLRAMCDAGVKNGLSYDKSKELALATMHGVAHLLEGTDKTLNELIAQVTSPGGTTLAGLTAFDDFKFEYMMFEVFKRTINRAEELGK